MSLTVSAAEDSWASSITYVTGGSAVPTLSVDGIHFELRDAAAYRLDWEAAGVGGVQVTSSYSYANNPALESAFLSVLGKPLEVRSPDGLPNGTDSSDAVQTKHLYWGATDLGAIAAGQTVVLDADGVTLSAP